jgi:hypothetical protein
VKGEGSLYRRSGVFWVTINYGPPGDRKRHRESLETTSATIAKDKAKEVRRRLEAGPIMERRVRVGDLLDELLTHLELKDGRLSTQDGVGLAWPSCRMM